MREVLVDRPRLADAPLLHNHEAQAVDDAVALVPMPFEVGEGFKLLLGRRVVHLAKDPGVELPSHLDRVIVANAGIAVSPLAEEGDGSVTT